MSFGTVGVLNVGAGDTKLSFDPENPAERIRAARIVTDMLKRGYALLVQSGTDAEGRAVYSRATAFDEKTCEYIIADFDPLIAADVDGAEADTPSKEASDEHTAAASRAEGDGAEGIAAAGKGRQGSRPVPGSGRKGRIKERRIKAADTHSVAVSRSSRGADFSLLDQFDGFAAMRNGLRAVANDRDEWAEIPMPLDGERLIIEPTYPRGADLAKIGAPVREEDEEGARIRNRWWSTRLRREIYVWEEAGGKICGAAVPRGARGVKFELTTLGCSVAWGIEQEAKAIHLLGELLPHHKFKTYLLTGMFLEKSKRSGVFYLFRKLRPTVAIRTEGDQTRVLAALCLHPIAYYADSWAGAMCPTDDVIAHLMLMRGDEHMFWKRANQHAPWMAEAAP